MTCIDNFGESFSAPRIGYSTGFEFDDSSSPSYLFNSTTLNPLHREDYMHNLPTYDLDYKEKMSNPNFIAQYREPSLSPTRHPGYKLQQPEYRPLMTERSHTQYHIGTPSAITRNYMDDMALVRGRLGTSERRSRPLHRHQNRYGRSLSTADESEFVHNRGVFNTTFPNVRGHFVIHPDWVSERMTPRTSRI
ncbi:hypothetical protein LOTGIDRAFT_234218 [Lottia gigantea]|uniref:Uncharacterized protein n=1 Tax=Lottia gigantea TaxID=225164 RepID=V3ZEM8_LOTGI|nr:hypothetical protein LOTGIDRAFT_234218 [Lottia gigantea]ESO89603.1 hypothetical protein LOTGIDRAFT_234218 [Lottia gigantea]